MSFDDNEDRAGLAPWQEHLTAYLAAQEGVETLRSRIQPNPPWPEADNPIVGYLVARAMEINEESCLQMAVAWAVATPGSSQRSTPEQLWSGSSTPEADANARRSAAAR